MFLREPLTLLHTDVDLTCVCNKKKKAKKCMKFVTPKKKKTPEAGKRIVHLVLGKLSGLANWW